MNEAKGCTVRTTISPIIQPTLKLMMRKEMKMVIVERSILDKREYRLLLIKSICLVYSARRCMLLLRGVTDDFFLFPFFDFLIAFNFAFTPIEKLDEIVQTNTNTSNRIASKLDSICVHLL